MFKKLKILYLKRQAAQHYLCAITIPEHMDCGTQIAQLMRPEMKQSEYAFDIVMDKLALLDSSTPIFRFRRE